MARALMVGDDVFVELIRDRQKKGIDLYDEVWDGVYLMPSMPNLAHQDLVADLTSVLREVVVKERRGRVQPGANVSDRRTDWKENFRVPDIVVVLNSGQAVDCNTHWFGGPDFLVEIQSPGDETDEKVSFYGALGTRELLVIHRDTRRLRLYRHDGQELALIKSTLLKGKRGLVSHVLPLAFQLRSIRGRPRTELWRTEGKAAQWTV
jgi:Uma2 family endonuclease